VNQAVSSAARHAVPVRGLDSSRTLFVLPDPRSGGFRASIRGHQLVLADPDSRHELAPTPDDLLSTSIASSLAWRARRFLRTRGLDDYVTVTAEARSRQNSGELTDIALTVTITESSEDTLAALTGLLQAALVARSQDVPLSVRVTAS
jgi:uncharacterized OsmC-like protein